MKLILQTNHRLRMMHCLETPREYLHKLYANTDRLITNKFDFNQILRDCGLSKEYVKQEGALLTNIFTFDYIVLQPEELAEITLFFQNEKIAGYYEDMTWISSDVPTKYIPFILINFFVCRYIDFSKFKSKCINILGIDFEVTDNMLKHWTANIFDIVIAQKTLGRKEFYEFLCWRKKHERTDFFNLEIFDDFNQLRKESYNAYKRLTDPRLRSWRTKRSFEFAGQFAHNPKLLDALSPHTTRVDRVFWKLLEQSKSDRFDVFEMTRLLKLLINTPRTYDKKEPDITITDPKLDIQAYLLTADELHNDELLIQNTHYFNNQYSLSLKAKATCEALLDRLFYFTIKSINSMINEKSTQLSLGDSGNPNYQYDLKNLDSIESVKNTLRSDILDGKNLLAEHKKLKEKLETDDKWTKYLESVEPLKQKIASLEKELTKVESLGELVETISSLNERMRQYIS